MSNLPHDVIFNILSRLPAKSILRFRCVCKLWKNLINEPSFVKMQLNHAIENSNPTLMLREFGLRTIDLDASSDKAVEIDYPCKTSNFGVQILGSCNGLLCIIPDEDVICIWNPCTKEYKKLPASPINFPQNESLCVCSSIAYGFGYDSTADDYKVVRIVFFDYQLDDCDVQVYALGTNSWRKIQDIPYYLYYKGVSGVLVNESLHWVATRHRDSDLIDLIVSFDIGDEEYHELPLPDYVDDGVYVSVLVLRGCLCITTNFYDVHVVWVMKEYGVKESWEKLFTIRQSTIIRSFEYLKPLWLSKNGELLMEKDGIDLVLYDPKNENARNLKIHGTPNWFETEMFVGTLVLLKSGTYVEKEEVATSKLPHNIIFNILLRLPVKSLLRFRCVCKHWCNSVTDPRFVEKHLSRATENNNLNLMLRGCYLYSIDLDASPNKAVEIDYPFKSPNYGVEIMGSCNGLLCITPCEDVVCLWNPCTKEYKKLPVAPINFPQKESLWGCSSIIYGFGYVPTIDDYKVVRIVYFDYEVDDSDVQIYTLGTNSWRNIQDIPYYPCYKKVSGVLVNGSLHWVATRHPDSDLSKLIVAFDIGDEEYRVVPQPNYLTNEFHMNVGVLRGCLCILSNFYKICVDVWVMKDYGVKESWARLFTIAQPTVIRSFEYLKPLCFFKKGEIILEKDNKGLVLYDPQHGRARNLKIDGIPDWFEGETYVESLVSLKSGTYVGQEQTCGDKKKKKKKKKRVEVSLVV